MSNTDTSHERMVRFSGVLVALLAVGALAAGCEDDNRRPSEPAPIAATGAPPFHPPSYPPGRRIDSIASAVLDGGRIPVYVVTSRSDSMRVAGRFDVIEVHAFDSTRKQWVRVLSDSIEGGRTIAFADVTGDGRDDLLVPMAQGGNDPVATNGLHVYSSHGGGIRRVFRSTWMDPKIDSVAGIRGKVISVHRTLWPLFAPRADALVYIEDVFAYRDGRFRSVLAEAHPYYAQQARAARAEYDAARDTFELRPIVAVDSTADVDDSLAYAHELRLYQRSALVVLNLVKSGDVRAARAFWSREMPFLRAALREEHFDELETFCTRLMDVG